MTAPLNDDFADAIVIADPTFYEVQATNVDATDVPGEMKPVVCEGTVWWRFTPDADHTYLFRTNPPTSGTAIEDTIIAVYTGTDPTALTLIEEADDEFDENDDWIGTYSVLTFAATAGTTYHLVVGGYQTSRGGFTLKLEQLPDPPSPNAGDQFDGVGTLTVAARATEHQVATGVAISSSGELQAYHAAQPAGQRRYRWMFNDPTNSESWEMPINPRTMSSPHNPRTFKYAQGVEAGIDRLRVFETPQMPHVWEFGGVIRSKQHHDDLLYWASKEHEIEISDHLGRTFEVIVQVFDPQDRVPRKWHPPTASLSDNRRWRMTYTMRALLLRRIS